MTELSEDLIEIRDLCMNSHWSDIGEMDGS